MTDPIALPVLPIGPVLDQIVATLVADGVGVLQAPPGAGKTTLVPLALLHAGRISGKIIVLEPRRLAVQGAARRMAQIKGQEVGQTIGFRMRGETRVSKSTRIEVVTEGVLTRLIQNDPELTGIGAIVFDEFHERSLNADLGLALAWDVCQALRPDLKILVMSATLDAQPIADMLKAPIITSKGRSFPVETKWLPQPLRKDMRFEQAAAELVRRAFEETQGGVLVFLPGEAEIRRTLDLLEGKLGPEARVLPLFGALPFSEQQHAIQPLNEGRKVVLATSIAETSLTIEDIRVVVDTGRARQPVLDVARGMAKLVTRPVSRAEAEQRRGRAGRMAPGWCYRMWTAPAEGALPEHPSPEIETGDLTGFALDLAQWGGNPKTMAFLTPPDPAGFAEAQKLLQGLGALDGSSRITTHGQDMARLPLHPRLSHMLTKAGKGAAPIAALLNELTSIDRHQLDLAPAIATPPGSLRREITRLEKLVPRHTMTSNAQALALAYPDRIGKRRPGLDARYLLSSGSGAMMPNEASLAHAEFIVAVDLDGAGREPKVRRAIQISLPELHEVFADQIAWHETCEWSSKDRKIISRKQERLGQLVLKEIAWKSPPADMLWAAAAQGIQDVGLQFSGKAKLLQTRAEFARPTTQGPDLSDASLHANVEDWLFPMLAAPPKNAPEIRAIDVLPALQAMFDWDQKNKLDTVAPKEFTAPTGRKCQIDYSKDRASISIKLQEMFGVTRHPMVAGQPLSVTLLSPAGRPLQTTSDLPGFWASSYADVRRDMRGRYPKHPWPENPAEAAPTARAKPRKV